MIDKNYCMSSFLAFRYIADDNKDFAEGMHHMLCKRVPETYKKLISDADDAELVIQNTIRMVRGERLGIMLSGGMDSAILASFLPKGTDAYTFRFLGGNFQSDELRRAEQFAQLYGLHLHYVDIDWTTVERNVDIVMNNRQAPVHSIEPQIYEAAMQAKADGVTMMVIGDESDYVFGGMNGLYSQDWDYQSFIDRYIYVNPQEVLCDPADISSVFEPYRLGPNSLNWIQLMDEIMVDESRQSYLNAFTAAGLSYIDPYSIMKMAHPLDIKRLRNGDSKYIIRDLFRRRYPEFNVPEKLPMPRPVDKYFETWEGPHRDEFRKDIDLSRYKGNQRWLIWCLERFLNNMEKQQ